MPRKEARDLEFRPNETLTETRLMDIRTSVETNTTEVTGALDESSKELIRIRRANELILGEEVEEPIEE